MVKAERPPPPQHIRVFLSSPGDVAEERELARRLIKEELPVDPFLRDRITFDIVSWDDPAAPTPMTAGLTPQEAVDRFGWKPSQCEFAVVVLWSRMGTLLDVARSGEKPVGGPYLSGTEWEFEDAWGGWTARKRPEILVYRRTEEPRVGMRDPEWAEKQRQFELVDRFFERFKNPDRSLRGGWTGYETPARFKERLASDLRHLLRKRLVVEHVRLEAERIAAEKGVPAAPLRAVLARYSEHEVPEHDIPERLAHYADEFGAVRKQLERRTNDPPEAEAARHRAVELLEASDLDGAQAVLAEARQSLSESREQTAREEVAILADEARVHRLRLDYTAAADALLDAARLVAGFDPAQAWRHTLEAGAAMMSQGHEFGDNAALVRAIAVFRDALVLAPRSERPKDWAETQHSLGEALRALGAGETGTARLEQAVVAFQAALEVRTRERDPLGWAATQHSLGEALWALSERDVGPARLEEAVAAYRAALEVRARERRPLQWAETQTNLGIALQALGWRESGTARLEEAVATLRAALEVRTRERDPLGWAWTQTNLGSALEWLGEREVGTARLKEAVETLRAALEVRTRERLPLGWALTQSSLGEALRTLGKCEAGTARLEEAVETLRAAQQARSRERDPLGWVWTQHHLGDALRTLGEREAGTARLEEAVETLRAALEEWTRERSPLGWAWTQHRLGTAIAEIGTRTGNPARWREALGYAEAALEVFEAAEAEAGAASHYAAETRAQRAAICAKLMDCAHS